MDILADYDLEFDFPHRKLTLYDVKGCSELTPPGFNNITAIRFKFDEQRSVLLPVEIDGKKLTAILDTGASYHAITKAGLRKLSVTDAMLKSDAVIDAVGVGNVVAKQQVHKFKTFSIGDKSFSDVSIGVLNTSLQEGEVLLGQQYLLTRRFWVSSATRTVYFENKPATGLRAGACFPLSATISGWVSSNALNGGGLPSTPRIEADGKLQRFVVGPRCASAFELCHRQRAVRF